MMVAGRTPLRRLKEETSDLHLLAEQHVRILDRDATVADYERYLRAMWGFHAPIEEQFGVAPALTAIGFEPDARRRASLLVRDLTALGSASPSHRCSALPAMPTLAHALGVAYVLEGSTLGGRYILAKLPAALAPLAGTATAFLTGYGDDTGTRWRAFMALAVEHLADDTACDAAVAAARDTFARLIDWLALHDTRDARRGLPHLREVHP